MRQRILIVAMVTLIIDKGADAKIPVEVPEYEVGILQDVHGEASVFEVEHARREVELVDPDFQVMFDGLVSKYAASQDSNDARARYFARPGQLERYIERMQPDAPRTAAPAPAPAKPATGGRRRAADKPANKPADKPADAGKGEGVDEGEGTLTAEQVADLLAKPVEEIVPLLATLDDADLTALEQAETEGAGREDLLAALDDEGEKRK